MPLKNYSILKGRPIHDRLGTDGSPHYQVEVSADGDLYRIAVNVRSQDGSEVQYLVRSHFEHPITAGLSPLPEGLHAQPSQPNDSLAVDFIRSNIAQPWEFKPLPMTLAGPDNDLNEKLNGYVQRAMSDERAMIYAFGDTWGPEAKADRYFGFKPGRGIHDIHFNQGNPPGPFAASNGKYQDGCLIFEFPATDKPTQWVGIFLKFQTQAWHSDDSDGTPIVAPDPAHPDEPHTPIDRDVIPPQDVPDGLVRIVAALVNDTASPEHEKVTLLNTSDTSVDLTGWKLLDKLKQASPLDGRLDPGEARRFDVHLPMTLSNRGGLITLVNAEGLKVHGVSYTRDQARQAGRTIPFQS